ncbi:MAG: hypothetical protein GY859_13645, partial [Desulfobacterales bacterium]|nr:hypothetical protein [Desulfobacterales bacterium]
MKRLAVETRPKSIRGGLAMILFLTAAMLASNIFMGTAVAQMRIVVLPFYTEKGLDAKDGGRDSLHYRRMMRFINNQLVRHGFDVINPFAKDASEREYNRVMERAREDSSLACLEVCKKYGVDAAYVVWLKVKRKTTPDGYCKVSARVDGEGYDSGGRDLGASVSKSYKLARSDCDDAIADVEKEVGDVVGRALTAWSGESGRSSGSVVVSGGSGAGESSGGGILQRNLEKTQNRLEVRLDGASEYELVEVFGKVLNTATGVLDTKRLNMNIQPDTPQACYSTWRAHIEDTDPFRLQA